MNEAEQAKEKAPGRASGRVGTTAGFRRVLLVVDDSGEARAAARYADEVARQFAGTVATVPVTEAKARRRARRLSGATGRGGDMTTCAVSGPTEGARSRALAEEVARAAEDFGADVVVLGLSRARLARHRLAPSLRALVAQATEVPVLLAPAAWGDARLDGEDRTDRSGADSAETGRDDAVRPGPDDDTAPAGRVRSGRFARV